MQMKQPFLTYFPALAMRELLFILDYTSANPLVGSRNDQLSTTALELGMSNYQLLQITNNLYRLNKWGDIPQTWRK